MNPAATHPIGAHIDDGDPLAAAQALGADCVQVFLSNPQGWEKPPERDDADELRASPVGIYVHAPYLINVCSPRNNVRYGSRKILQQTCDAAAAIGAAAVIVHPGHFYELDREGCVVLSLIVEIATMEHGLARIAESLTAT